MNVRNRIVYQNEISDILDVNYQYPYWFVSIFLIISWVITLVLGRERKAAAND